MAKLIISGFLAVLLCFSMVNGADDLATKCAAEFQKVTACLSYATGKASTPTRDCCTATTDLRNTDPGCLCYIIQQVHNGSNPAIKSMGIQESRLLQLPSACRLVNASVAECPTLLHLAPNSPDAAIFTNISAPGSPATPVSTTPSGTASPSTASGIWHKPCTGVTVIVAVVVFFLALPSGIMST